MRFIIDMVHHNPGEPPFKTAFLNPAHLVDYGFNGQVFKHLNCVATFAATGLDVFPKGSPDQRWHSDFENARKQEIAAAKAKGLRVYYHLDLFVLPRRVVEYFKTEICDDVTERIDLFKPRTLELHRILFDELCERFPEVDGYIVRVGETYLYDTPFHVGNGPIPRIGTSWTPTYQYEAVLDGEQPTPAWSGAQAAAYVRLIEFLREELCIKHNKLLFFRTWDIFPDKLHASVAHYLEVTNQIAPHPNLLFSIKHTALDFWRRVKVNECLGLGKHSQVIEVQCQREYEGKGAFPNYVMDGAINGFTENREKLGLQELLKKPLIKGTYTWSRGGGWYGPYIGNEIWPDLNAYVVAQFCANPTRTEPEIFAEYATEKLGLSSEDAVRFRELCQSATQGLLLGRYCHDFDQILDESLLPTALWFRDDRLGGRQQLALVFKYLYTHQLLPAALDEKRQAVAFWKRAKSLAEEIKWPQPKTAEFVTISTRYGHLLFEMVYHGWSVLIAGFVGDQIGTYDAEAIQEACGSYISARDRYHALASDPQCPSLFKGVYFNLPESAEVEGLDASVEYYKRKASVG